MILRRFLHALALAACLLPAAAQAANVSEWSTSASSNNATPPNGFPEGMAPSAVNDAAREVMAAVARWYADSNGSLALGGTGTAYTLTSNSSHATLADQSLIVAEVNTDNTGAATLAVDGLAAKSIKMPDGGDPPAGTLKDGAVVVLAYESSAEVYVLIAGAASGSAALADTGTDSGDIPVLGAAGLDSEIHGSAVPVGTVLDYAGATAPTGWLILNGDSICPAAGTCDQESDDYEDLYTLMWDSVANDNAPVAGGRGASAAADWAANKALTLPDARGRAVIGSGTGADLTERTHGDTGGAETHTLTVDEMPLHGHPYRVSTTGSASSESTGGIALDSASDTNRAAYSGTPSSSSSQTIGGTGGDGAHANMQPWLALTKIVRF